MAKADLTPLPATESSTGHCQQSSLALPAQPSLQADQLFGTDRLAYEDQDARVQAEVTVHPRACGCAVRCLADSRFLGRILHHQIQLSFVFIEIELALGPVR